MVVLVEVQNQLPVHVYPLYVKKKNQNKYTRNFQQSNGICWRWKIDKKMDSRGIEPRTTPMLREYYTTKPQALFVEEWLNLKQ